MTKPKSFFILKVYTILILVLSVLSLFQFNDIGPLKVGADAVSDIPDTKHENSEDLKNNPGLAKDMEAGPNIDSLDFYKFEVTLRQDEGEVTQKQDQTDTLKRDPEKTYTEKDYGNYNMDRDYIRVIQMEYNRLMKEHKQKHPFDSQIIDDNKKNVERTVENFETTTPIAESTESLEVLYERLVAEDEARIIPDLGEGGLPCHMVGNDFELSEKSLKKYSTNIHLSDRISYQRNLTDVRHKQCKNITYDAELPSTSVVIIFHNEPYSLLIRTIWSVLNTCKRAHPFYSKAATTDRYGNPMNFGYKGQNNSDPYIYLKEIILVDDYSFVPELRGKLDHYVKTRLPKLVKIVRLPKYSGLIVARVEGARAATGDVLVFLDAHCEAQPDWLRPLLQRFKEGFKGALVPKIDVLDMADLHYVVCDYKACPDGDGIEIGGFSFDGQYQWARIPPWEQERRGSSISPVRTPTMAGGLFAMEREYFWHIGSYDEQMQGWGGENLEISFRIWMCGGMIEAIPCSRIGHVFRQFFPYRAVQDTFGRNTARVAEVWMDDYAAIFYLHRPEFQHNKSLIGDVTDRKILREKLQCKSFDWYLKNVYKEKYVHIRDSVIYGRIRNPITGLCLDMMTKKSGGFVGLYQCNLKINLNQEFSLSHHGELRHELGCIIGFNISDKDGTKIFRITCPVTPDQPEWKILKTGQILHLYTDLCLAVDSPTAIKPNLKPCRESDEMQRWTQDIKTFRNGIYYDSKLIPRSQIEVLRRLPKLSPIIRFVEDTSPQPVTKDTLRSLTEGSPKSITEDTLRSVTDESLQSVTDKSLRSVTDESLLSVTDESLRSVTEYHEETESETLKLYYDETPSTAPPIFLAMPGGIDYL